MMEKIISLFVNRPVSTFMMTLFLIITGILGIIFIPREFYPEIEQPKLIIYAPYSSASTEDIRTLVTIPLEEGLSSIQGLENIRSLSQPGMVLIEIDLQWGTEMLKAGLQAREIIDSVFPSLPSGIQKPSVIPLNLNEIPILTLALIPDNGSSLSSLKRQAQQELKTEIQQVEGVSGVILVGGWDEEVKIEVFPDQIQNRGISVQSMAAAIENNNINYPVGTLKEGSKDILVKVRGKAEELQDLSSLNVSNPESNQSFKIADVGSIDFSNKEQSSFFSSNGRECIGMLVLRRPGSNPVQVAKDVKKMTNRLNQRYSDMHIEVVHDSTTSIRDNTKGLLLSLIMGMAISFIIVILFTGSLSASLILLSSLPISLIATVGFLQLFKSSLNMMSLGGLALGIGMLVDNSVVILENLVSRKSRTNEEIISGTLEMSKSTLGSTLTSVIIFIPLYFLPGVIGSLYKDLALSVGISLLVSFAISISYIPVCYRMFLPSPGKEGMIISKIKSKYEKILNRIFKKPMLFLPILFILIIPFPFLIKAARFQYFPDSNFKELELVIQYPPGTSISWIKGQEKMISEMILKLPSTNSVFSRDGSEKNDFYYLSNPDENSSRLKMNILTDQQDFTIKEVSSLLKDYYSIQITPPQDPIMAVLGIDKNKDYILTADNRETLNELSADLKDRYGKELFLIPQDILPELHIYPKRNQLSKAQLNITDLVSTLNSLLEGRYCGKLTMEGIDYDVKLSPESPFYPEKATLLGPNGTRIAISELAEIEWVGIPSKMLRQNKKDALWIVDNDQIPGLQEIFPDIDKADSSLFKKYSIEIMLIFILSLLALYLFLGIQFESFTKQFLIFTTIPLAALGSWYALMASGSIISIQSILGVLVLLGLVVNNGIILIDSVQDKVLTRDTLIKIAGARLRPILITTSTTLLSMFPLAVNLFGKTPQQTMAISIGGGLILSTVVTIFLLPFLIFISSKWRGNASLQS